MTIWNQEIIRTKLRDIAKSKGLRTPDVQLLLAQERFLARLLSIPEGQNYVWKGGSLILRRYNQLEKPRFTVDVDLLARGASIDRCEEDFRRAKALDLSDGFQFLEMTSSEFERDTPYGGTSYSLDWHFFGKAAARRLKIDVCAGDYVDHIEIDTKEIFLVSEEDSLTIKIYPASFIFAEKLHAMHQFATGNTRLKDFIDMWNLIKLDPSKSETAKAILNCFERRKTELDSSKLMRVLSDDDYISILQKRMIKTEFKKLGLPNIKEICTDLQAFLMGLEFE